MTRPDLPFILEPDTLDAQRSATGLLIIDLSRPETYARAHIPDALHLNYAEIVATRPPMMGLLPTEAHLSRVLSSLGLTPDLHVVAYDDEGGGKAARLLWTLEVVGHQHYSLLNGGLRAWANEGHPMDDAPVTGAPRHYPVTCHEDAVATKDYILGRLGDPDFALLDARSPAEYQGIDQRAARGGHIPGAVNMEWTLAMDFERNLRLKPEEELRQMLAERDITPEQEVITYCQTHHRSALTYAVMKSLGYARLRGYPGSWSEWGNDPDTPVE
jgi:Rhodanese-related sulfurtransferase